MIIWETARKHNISDENIKYVYELAHGKHQLVIRTQFSGNNVLLKEPRTIVYEKILSVA